MNRDIMWCLPILLVLCAVGATGSTWWLGTFTLPFSDVPFLLTSGSAQLEGMLTFWTFIIILQASTRFYVIEYVTWVVQAP
jgi:phospholipid-translocating ATPase